MNITTLSTLPDETFFRLIKMIARNGKYFTCTFTKQNGEVRKMTGRTGVGKYVNGGGLPYKPATYRNLVVWEVRKRQYRQIKTDEIISFKQGDVYIQRYIPTTKRPIEEILQHETNKPKEYQL